MCCSVQEIILKITSFNNLWRKFYLWLADLPSSFSLFTCCSSPSSVDWALLVRGLCRLLPPLPPFSPLEHLSPSLVPDREPSFCLDRRSLFPPALTTPLPSLLCLWEWWWRCSLSPPPTPSSTELWWWCLRPPSLLQLLSLFPSLHRVPSCSLLRLWWTWCRPSLACPVSPFSLVSLEGRSLWRWCLRGGCDCGGSITGATRSSGVPPSPCKSWGLSQSLWGLMGPSQRGSTTRGRSRWVLMSGRRWRLEVSRGLSSSWYNASLLASMCFRIWVVRCSHTDIIFRERCCSLLVKKRFMETNLLASDRQSYIKQLGMVLT